MHFALVVADLDLQRTLRGIARLGVQPARLRDALGVRPPGIVELLWRVVRGPARHPAIGRCLAEPGDSLRESLAVDHQRQGAPQARLPLERRPRQVEAVVIHGQLRRHVQLAGQVLLDPGELLRRHDVGDVQLARPVLPEFGARIGMVEIVHALDPGARVVPVMAVALGNHVRAHYPVAQHERAIRQQPARAGVLRPVLRQRRPVHREAAGLCEQPEQVRRRVAEPDHHGPVIGSVDAERLRRTFPTHDFGGIDHRLEGLGVRRRRGRIDQPPHPGHEIRGAQRIAV